MFGQQPDQLMDGQGSVLLQYTEESQPRLGYVAPITSQ